MPGLGTIINVAAIAVGGVIGVAAGHRLPDRARHTLMQGLGLAVLAVGVIGLEPLNDPDRGLRRVVITIGALGLGALVGEALRLETRLEEAGDALKRRFGVSDEGEVAPDFQKGAPGSPFVEGFVVATTVFVVGPLAILGSVDDGLGAGLRLLVIKSALDGVAVTGFASVYGVGAIASILPVALYQGLLTALATVVAPLLTPEVLSQLGAVGSILVLGIGVRLLEIKQVPVVNLGPALVVGPAVAALVDAFL